jgi:hypothetical protein
MKQIGLSLILGFSPLFLWAQLPVQVFAGNRGAEYNFLWFKDLDKKAKWSLFNTTFFTVDYNNRANNVYEIYQVATYNLTKNWGLAGGGRFSGGAFAPQMAISYQILTKDVYFNIFPGVQYMPLTQTMGYSVFGLFFYQPKISEKWKMFNQILFEPLFTNKGHLFSYQQIRVGLNYKDWVQFGLGANLEQMGTEFKSNHNLGIFIRKEL